MTMKVTLLQEDSGIYLRFSAKTYLFGPVSTASSDIIKKVSIGYVAGSTGTGTPQRDLTYELNQERLKTTLAQFLQLSIKTLNLAMFSLRLLMFLQSQRTHTLNWTVKNCMFSMFLLTVLRSREVKIIRRLPNTSKENKSNLLQMRMMHSSKTEMILDQCKLLIEK